MITSSAITLAAALFGSGVVGYIWWRRFTTHGNLHRLTSRRAGQRRAAVAFLSQHGGSSTRGAVLERLKDAEPSVRGAVLQLLPTLDAPPAEIATALQAVVEERILCSEEARLDALTALSKYGASSVDSIVGGFSHYSEKEYHRALATLRELSAAPERLAEACINAFSSWCLFVRQHALHELEKHPTQRVKQTLLDRLTWRPAAFGSSWPDLSWPSKVAVAETLVKLGEPTGLETLYNELDRANDDALNALLSVGEEPEEVISCLLHGTHYTRGGELVGPVRELVVRQGWNPSLERRVRMVIHAAEARAKPVADVLDRLERRAEVHKLALVRVWRFLADALRYYQEGFDFVIHYEPEIGHKENEWGDPDFQFSQHPECNPHGPVYGYDWIVDSPERLELRKGDRLELEMKG